jgi:RNase_H superfamily
MKSNKPRILLVDIETAPILGYCWGLWENNLALNQVKSDWHLLSWSAKWLGDPASKIMYQDQRKAKDIEDDKDLLLGIWTLLDQADVVIGQNSKAFDVKKLNARFILNGMQPPSSFKQIDTMLIAKKHFAFTSNKLEYMTNKLCTKYKKLKTKKYQGFELWSECLKRNPEAWKEMEKYNKYDVLSLEELYYKLIPWDNSVNFNVYANDLTLRCTCGSESFMSKGYYYSATGKFSRHRCNSCGSEIRGVTNLLTSKKKKSLKRGTIR